MFSKTKEKIRRKLEKLRRFLRNIEPPFPDTNTLGPYCDNTIGRNAVNVSFLKIFNKRFRLEDIDWARRELYKGGRISWRLMRWGKCPKDAQGIRIRLNRGLFRDHFLIFPDLTRAEQELKYRKVSFK